MKKINLGLLSSLCVILPSFSFSAIGAPQVVALPGGLDASIKTIIGAIKWIALFVAVVMVIYTGVKYMTAGAGTKASVKSDLIPMAIGAIIVSLAATIVEKVFSIFAT